MTCTNCTTRQIKTSHGGYSSSCLQCAASLVISARPSKAMQEGHLYALTRRKGALSREAILQAVKFIKPADSPLYSGASSYRNSSRATRDSSMSANIYTVRGFNDLLKIPADRRAACFRDIEYALALHELVHGDAAKDARFEMREWRDDGKHDVDVLDNDGNALLTLEITPT